MAGSGDHVMVLLPCLAAKMKQAGAINTTLMEEAGVSYNPIDRARQGKPIRIANAIAIYEALNTRKFVRRPHHRSKQAW